MVAAVAAETAEDADAKKWLLRSRFSLLFPWPASGWQSTRRGPFFLSAHQEHRWPFRREVEKLCHMDCPRCSAEIRGNERNCPSCACDVGYPNVRAAKEYEEKTALARRYEKALGNASRRGCGEVVADFLTAMKSSVAVFCRSPSKVKELVSSANELYATFYQLVGAGSRRLEGVKMDLQRRIADSIMFPYYEREIRFATLSLDGTGAAAYGTCSVVLKDVAISERATVFEENSVLFCERLGLGVAKALPPGYRATWEDRGVLATGKLEPRIEATTTAAEFPGILVGRTGQDFIEVHIFGSLDRRSIERIVATEPKTEADRILLAEIARHTVLEVLQ